MRIEMMSQTVLAQLQQGDPHDKKVTAASVLDFLSMWLALLSPTPDAAADQTENMANSEEEANQQPTPEKKVNNLADLSIPCLVNNVMPKTTAQLTALTAFSNAEGMEETSKELIQAVQPKNPVALFTEADLAKQQDTIILPQETAAVSGALAAVTAVVAPKSDPKAAQVERVAVAAKQNTDVTVEKAPVSKEKITFSKIFDSDKAAAVDVQGKAEGLQIEEIEELSVQEEFAQPDGVGKQEQHCQLTHYPITTAETIATECPDSTPLRANILEQVAEQLEFTSFSAGEKKLFIRLKPDTLGQLEIRLRLLEGQLTARIITDNPQVKQVLEASVGQLQERLQSQQINVAEFSVSVGQEGSYGQQQTPWQQQFRQRPTLPQLVPEETFMPIKTVSMWSNLDLRA